MKTCSSAFSLLKLQLYPGWTLWSSFLTRSLSQYLQLVCTKKHHLLLVMILNKSTSTAGCPNPLFSHINSTQSQYKWHTGKSYATFAPSDLIRAAFSKQKEMWGTTADMNKFKPHDTHRWARFSDSLSTPEESFLNSPGADIKCQAEFWVHGNKSDAKLQRAAATSW